MSPDRVMQPGRPAAVVYGMNPSPQSERQPRERAVRCPNHRRVETWNVSGLCDTCEQARGASRDA